MSSHHGERYKQSSNVCLRSPKTKWAKRPWPLQRRVSEQPASTPARQTQFTSELDCWTCRESKARSGVGAEGSPESILPRLDSHVGPWKGSKNPGLWPTGSPRLFLLYVLGQQRIEKNHGQTTQVLAREASRRERTGGAGIIFRVRDWAGDHSKMHITQILLVNRYLQMCTDVCVFRGQHTLHIYIFELSAGGGQTKWYSSNNKQSCT